MIVQCEKCRTKFRIADERVSAKGVKVRCSRCAHVFVARREDDPTTQNFTPSGPDTARLAPSELLSLAAKTHPDQPDPSGANRIPAATTEQAARALGFDGSTIDRVDSEVVTVQSHLPQSAPPPLPPRDSGPSEAPTFQVAQPSPALSGAHGVPPPPPPVSGDYFPPPSTAPQPFAPPGSPDDDALDDALIGVSPFAEPESTGTGSHPGASPPPSSDDFASPFNEPTPYRTNAGDFGAFAEPTAGGVQSQPPAPDSMFAAPLNPAPNPASSPFAAPLDGPGNSADIPGLLPPDALDDGDPFGGEELVDDEGFAPPSPASALPAATPVARIGLEQAAAVPNLSEKWSQAETTAIAAAYDEHQVPSPPPVRHELPQVGDRGGVWPSLVGALLGGALVLTFLPEVGAGILDTFSRRGGDAINRVSHQRYLPESLQTLRPIATHVVAYRIASGAQVLVVRGVARNLSAAPVQGLSAVALAMDGDTVVARASAPVGVLLDPAVLAGLESSGLVASAYAQRSARATEISIEPGGERPFMVVFPEMPPNPADLAFVVEFVPFDP